MFENVKIFDFTIGDNIWLFEKCFLGNFKYKNITIRYTYWLVLHFDVIMSVKEFINTI